MKSSCTVALVVGLLTAVDVASAQPHQLMQVGGSLACEVVPCSAPGDSCVYAFRPDGSPSESGTCVAMIADALVCRYRDNHDYETYCCTDPAGAQCPGETTCVMLADAPFGICLGPDTGLRFCSDPPTLLDVALCRDLPWVGYDWSHGDCDNDQIYNQDEVGDALCDGPGYCGCWADVEPNIGGGYVVDSADVAFVESCIRGERDEGCAAADLNCNGQIDYCDLAAVQSAVGTDAADPLVCGMVRCEGCEIDGRCVAATRDDCNAIMGAFHGRDPTCGGLPAWLPVSPLPAPVDASAADGSSSDGVSFRGGGGCDCDAGGGRAPIEEGLPLLLVLALSRGRRRSPTV